MVPVKGKEAVLFLKKKNQKNFYSSAWPRIVDGHGRDIKVFCFFSSEKKALLSS
jgi:hypothetical protein